MNMQRRRVLTSIASGTLLAGFGTALPGLASAGMQCTPWQPFNMGMVRKCTVGVRVPRLRAQQCDQWCWAACIEAAFRIGGYRVSQERIVKKIFGSEFVCRPAIGPQIAHAVEGEWTDDRGHDFYAEFNLLADLMFGVVNPGALQQASVYLREDIPLINGALGHATLMTAMSWLEDNFEQQRLAEIIVRDPWPGNPQRRTLTPAEFHGTFFVGAITVS